MRTRASLIVLRQRSPVGGVEASRRDARRKRSESRIGEGALESLKIETRIRGLVAEQDLLDGDANVIAV
jgi:hypothetical protein